MNNTATQLRYIYHDIIPLLKERKYKADYNTSLFKGPWGALLFMFYYEQYADDQADNATALLEELYAEYAPEKGDNYAFCNGHTGPFWLLEHLTRHEFLDLDINELASDFVTATILQSNFHLEHQNYDFLHGSSGMCNFLLRFASRPDVAEHLGHFVQKLWDNSVMTDKGRSLPFFYTHDKPEGIFCNSFSLAHGSCSLLIIVAKIYEAGIAKERCQSLITESIPFILQNQNAVSDDSMHALYPAILDGKSTDSRLSWCYGDLNVAMMLWHCGKVFGEEHWKEEALHIMRYNMRRDTDEAAGIVDNCLCHGSGGIAAFYRKFWFETGDEAFLRCANHWQEKATEKIVFPEDHSKHGIKMWLGKDKQWEYVWDLLDGSSGVGLSMLSQMHPQALPWDECFLLS
ncbi:Lanthionine synthetase C-like protein [Chitinophaga eiseniae]|uniref:Lanthionine synthetase C-like protein n=1 Tax=Chitinophaga eiseniae TaxID=634771 RepID=A0A1T4NG78_9BACT|nr:lanthionine synthetase LanC family protein [Chitinophaga eiseniae]SJZ78262.1 Lanthionine synthetase C-like protein [Chitinophaga eiseniae]